LDAFGEVERDVRKILEKLREKLLYVIPAAEFVRRGHVQHKRREGQDVGQLSYLILGSE